MTICQYTSKSESDSQYFAERFAEIVEPGVVIYLNGDLGAGKTFFSRHFIQALGFDGRVKSPTYTIVEPYEVGSVRIFHFDLYRLADPEELEYIGIRDYFSDDTVCLVEWSEKGEPLLSSADIVIDFDIIIDGRQVTAKAVTNKGAHELTKLNSLLQGSCS